MVDVAGVVVKSGTNARACECAEPAGRVWCWTCLGAVVRDYLHFDARPPRDPDGALKRGRVRMAPVGARQTGGPRRSEPE